jgi:tetratricopeptide (TPR) repeat protein
MNHAEMFERAVRLKDANNLPGAQEILEQLISEKPDYEGYHYYLAHLYWEQGLLEKATASFRRATELMPASERASLGLFHCLWELGRQEEALSEIERFLKIADCKDYRQILSEINAIP